MQTFPLGIFGASGYSGIELTRLVLGHGQARLAFATSDRWVGQTVRAVTGVDVPLAFTPHLLPVKRGILSTAIARLRPGVTHAQVQQVLADAYGNEPFITLKPEPDAVRLAEVVHTPKCLVGAATDGTHLASISAIDNLLKGAASQAVQNMNLAMELPETMGLLS